MEDNIFQPSQQNKIIKDTVSSAISSLFPIEHKGRRLEISNISVADELNDQDFPLQRELKVSRKTWGYPVIGDVSLVDSANGRIITKAKKVKLAIIPKVTNRYTTIIDGNEYQTVNQLRRKPGVYSRIKQNGELESEFNLSKGLNFKMQLDPQSQVFSITPTGKNYKYNLWSLLNILGMPEANLIKKWGQKLVDINKKESLKTETSEMTSLYKVLLRKEPKDFNEVISGLKTYFEGTALDPKITKITLGEEYDKVSGDTLLSASQKLLQINKGEDVPDDRDSLIFKKMLSVDDLLLEHFGKTKKLLEAKLKRNLDIRDNIRDILPTNYFSRPIREFFTVGDLSSTPPQTNPVTIATDWRKTTPMGMGGISSSHQITMETRDVQPTHLGFLDPLSTPECVDYATLILTITGWKSSGDINKEDLVACNINGTLEFHKPTNTQEFDYDGLVYIFKNSKIDLFVTKGHRIWSRPLDKRSHLSYRIELAENVFYKDRLMKMGHYAYSGEELEVIDIEGETYNIIDWFSLLGWYISEGNLTKKYGIFISQNKKINKLNFKTLINLLDKLGLNYTIKKDNKGIYIKNKILAKYFEKFGYCYEKYLPDYVFTAPLAAREALLNSLLAGDGRKSFYRKTGQFQYNKVYTTTSPKLAEDTQRLMASLGFATSIKCYPDNREERYLDVYEVRAFHKDETQVLPSKGHNFSIHFKGKVYGITVPGGLLYTKRNNSSPVWTGNSLKVGVNVGLASETRKSGNDITTPVYDNSGNVVWLNPLEFYDNIVGFPDQFTIVNKQINPVDKIVNVMHNGDTKRVSAKEVKYWLRSPRSMFSYATNLVPFLPNVQGNRAATGGRMITQALPIDEKEAPNVRTWRDHQSTYEDWMGSYLAPQLAEGPKGEKRTGKVVKISKDYIHVLSDGKEEKIGLYNNFPLNQDGFLDSKPIVKVGDTVTSGQPLASTNYSTDDGALAIGKNLNVAYLSYKGYNFEDGAVITETAAKKLTHTMLHRVNDFFSPKTAVFDIKKFKAWYPDEITPDNVKKLDGSGLPKVGETFYPGETVLAYLNEKNLDDMDRVLKRLDKYTFNQYDKKLITWDEDEPGVVTDVKTNGRNIDVYIKSTHPFKEGDKLSGRYGNKYIVTKIIPDTMAPTRSDGTAVDVLLNPHGVPSRMNVGQLLETAAGKIAVKTGKPYIIKNFGDPNEDMSKTVLDQLTKLDIKPDEILYDGKTGKPFGRPIFVGNQYFLKLRHIVNKKNSAHNYGVYDVDEAPAGKGAQSIGVLDTYAYLAHGAKENLREMGEVKGRKNEEYWRNLQLGLPPTKPERNFIFEKLVTNLKGMGVNVEKNGNKLRIFPMTDSEILKLSNGEIDDPGELLKGKNLTARKGGLFDETITGGVKGKKWSHMSLATRLPNPMFEATIKKLLDLSDKSYQSVMLGTTMIDGLTGPDAIISQLSKINIDKDMKRYKEELRAAPKTNINKLNLKVRYLDALKDLKLDPVSAYTIANIPIIPPVFRQIYPLPSGDIVVADINKHYKDVGTINKTLKEGLQRDDLPDDRVLKAKNDLYNSIKAMQGFIDPITYSKEKYKGFLVELGDLKRGLIHGKAWSKRQDLSARSTITVEPTLGLDEIGIPTHLAYEMYKPLVIREIKESGYKAAQALKEYEEETPMAYSALRNVLKTRPILLNRAPSLHKHSVQAFKAVLMDGKTIRLNPLIVKGFNADFDGDTMSLMTPIGREAVEESKHMMPSQILFKHGDNSLVPGLGQEYTFGLYMLSKIDKVTDQKFDSIEQAKNSGIPWTHQFKLDGKPMTIGQFMINEKLPEQLRDYTRTLDGKRAQEILETIGKDYKNYFREVIDHWKDLGSTYAFIRGNTISISDLAIDHSFRDKLIKEELPKIDKLLTLQERTIARRQLTDTLQKRQNELLKGTTNGIFEMLESGSISKGKSGNVRQILTAPGVLEDISGNPKDTFFAKGYAEGLNAADYFNTLYGVRKGTVDRSVNTQESGALNKALVNVNRRLLITEEDCGSTKFLEFDVDDKDIMGRCSAETIKGIVKRNEIVSGKVIIAAKKNNINSLKVRSPLTCATVEGICQACYGVLPDGQLAPIGTNVGVLDSTAITERATQLSMQTFHSGGAGGSGITASFPRLEQLLKVPEKLSGKATLTETDGIVKSVKRNETGGFVVSVGDKSYTVAPGRTVTVSVGQTVSKGDSLSDGVVKPQELGALKTHLDAQRYLVNEASDIYGGSFYKKTFETVIRGISDNAQVEDAPDDSGFLRGDKASISYLEHLNRKRKTKGLDPIKFKPYFKTIDLSNADVEDWMTNITTNRVKAGLTVGASKGLYANIRGKDPIPAYVYGENFGKGVDYSKGEFY